MKYFKIYKLGFSLEYFDTKGLDINFLTARGNNFRIFHYRSISIHIPLPLLFKEVYTQHGLTYAPTTYNNFYRWFRK